MYKKAKINACRVDFGTIKRNIRTIYSKIAYLIYDLQKTLKTIYFIQYVSFQIYNFPHLKDKYKMIQL